jgi:hypothetical protein
MSYKHKPKAQIDDWRLDVVRDGRPKPLYVSKHTKAKQPKKGERADHKPKDGGKLIKASTLQKDPQFIEVLNSGQNHYRRFMEDAKANTNLPDVKILKDYITRCDIVIGIFKDAEYELGWGFYFIKGRTLCLRIINTGKTEELPFGVIPCRMLEEAVAMSQIYGDIKHSN